MRLPIVFRNILSFSRSSSVLIAAICLLIVFCCTGSIPPGVNESHYLPKAKFAWDNSFASGGDIFLQSSNSHWTASCAAGILAWFFQLSTVAWIGRLASWIFLILAWLRLCSSIRMPVVLRPIGLLAWFLLNHYGNWSGEWFVGGFEAKTLAYPCVVFALAKIVDDQWTGAWIWIGASMALHPVVGGWALVTCAIAWWVRSDRWQRLKSQAFGVFSGLIISLVGVLPALSGLAGDDLSGNVSAAQVHVFYRLAHHMSPRTFATDRYWAGGALLAGLIAATIIHRRRALASDNSQGLVHIVVIAWSSVAICAMGWLIDQAVKFGFRPDIAAKLLRFYFFRWADVVVPMAIVLVSADWVTRFSFTIDDDGDEPNRSIPGSAYALPLVLCFAVVAGLGHWMHDQRQSVPPADARLMSNDRVGSLPRYEDWLAVCQWIQQNTPSDSLWLTPKDQQTFKWHAQRAEVVNWKDVPQDNASVHQWFQRIQRCEPPKNRLGQARGWTTDELLALAKEYRFNWILVDRSTQTTPPQFEMKYPEFGENQSFAVFFVSDER